MEMDFGALSLLPPLLAIILAFLTKNVLLSLICAVFIGATMVAGNPLEGFVNVFGNYMIPKMSDSWNAGVIAMTLFVGSFSVMLERGGGAYAFGQAVKNRITTRKQGQIGAWFGGLMIWFSDSSNSVIVGPILRSVTDRLKISREKLAYICDSTASSVPLLLPITGLGALVMGIMKNELPEGTNLIETFIKAVPFNLYTITIVIMVFIVAFTGWDFGPMKRAEVRAQKYGKLVDDGAYVRKSETFVLPEGAHPTPWGLIIPLLALIGSLFAALIWTGPKDAGLMNAIINGDSMLSLTVAFFSASLVGVLIAMKDKVMNGRGAYKVFVDGFQQMIEAIMILIFSWCIGGVTSDAGTADFIVEATQGFMTPGIMLVSLFVGACFTSFATGTSWGTFAIFLPIAIPLALANDFPVFPAIGASLAGGLFGDHCSPISDSTILASLGASCDHLAHVKTQLPYAMLAAAASIVGYIVAAVTMNGVISLGTTIACMILFLFIMQKLDKTEKV